MGRHNHPIHYIKRPSDYENSMDRNNCKNRFDKRLRTLAVFDKTVRNREKASKLMQALPECIARLTLGWARSSCSQGFSYQGRTKGPLFQIFSVSRTS